MPAFVKDCLGTILRNKKSKRMFIGRVALTDRRTHTKQHKPKPVFLVGVHPFLSPKMQINTFSWGENTHWTARAFELKERRS